MLIGCSGSAITSWQIIVHAKVGSKPSSQFQPLSRVKGIGDEEIDFYLLTHIFMPLMIAEFFSSGDCPSALKFTFCAFIMNVFQLYYVLEISA